MGDFKQDRGKRFGGGFGGRDGGRKSWGGGGRDRGPATMHQAVCDECGNPCEVPFRPTEGKPVYCNICFGNKKKGGNERDGGRFSQENFNSHKNSGRNDFGNNAGGKGNDNELKKQLEVLNAKMDRIIRAVENSKNVKPLAAEKKTTKKIAKKIVKVVPAVKAKKSVKKISKKAKK